jgi:hypothetical protein
MSKLRRILLYNESIKIRHRGLKGDDVRNGMSGLQLEVFNVNGLIVAIEIGTSIQRNGDMRRLRSRDGRNQKRNSKDYGEGEMHPVKLGRASHRKCYRVKGTPNPLRMDPW